MWAAAADLSKVPQIHETKQQRDERMQWFRDAKFGMFIHWGPSSVGAVQVRLTEPFPAVADIVGADGGSAGGGSGTEALT